MTRQVKLEREAIQVRKNNGLITQFVLFAILRAIDLASLLAVLVNAWRQTGDWAHLDGRFVNATRNASTTVVTPSSTNVDRECREASSWERVDIDGAIQKYNIILGLAVFFNIISVGVYLTHFAFWIATLKMAFKEDASQRHDDRITRLTRSSLLSLMTAVIRDMPLSCLNTELLVLRSGRAGLVCIGCSSSASCSPQSYIKTLDSAKRLLYLSYTTMLVNSLWKGVSGFYRLSNIEGFQIHIIRACASIVFAFLYCATTFTPAMLVLIYRYFPIPGLHSPFVHQFAIRVVVVGGVIWIIGGSVLLCCPILNAIKLN